MNIADRDVSLRYAYGEIRLTRLNFYAPFFLGKSHFQSVEYQYGTYFARFYGPILFVIGIVSVVLSGLQVCRLGGSGPWKDLADGCGGLDQCHGNRGVVQPSVRTRLAADI